ncbi:MAG: methyltransferase domain-containing protein [Actinobacteria bacterium]|nr:methyltransferase domain-containing protein [Actinomycetota bacterium]
MSWSQTAYADPAGYLAHRARLVVELGPRLRPGDRILDLACGDGGLADFLPEQRYLGVDASPEMVASARAAGRDVVEGDLNGYEPPEPVQATTIFRAVYYARDRRELLRRVGGFTETKLVFDLNPRQYRVDDVRADLEAAGFDRLVLHPFLFPQRHAPPAAVVRALERTGPLARALLRARFSYLCAAFRTTA